MVCFVVFFVILVGGATKVDRTWKTAQPARRRLASSTGEITAESSVLPLCNDENDERLEPLWSVRDFNTACALCYNMWWLSAATGSFYLDIVSRHKAPLRGLARQNSNEINTAYQKGHNCESGTVRPSQARTQQTNNARKVFLDAKYSDENSFHRGLDSSEGF